MAANDTVTLDPVSEYLSGCIYCEDYATGEISSLTYGEKQFCSCTNTNRNRKPPQCLRVEMPTRANVEAENVEG